MSRPTPHDPDRYLAWLLESILRRVAQLERAQPDAYSILDQQDTPQERVRLGRQDDGSYGLVIRDASGTTTHTLT